MGQVSQATDAKLNRQVALTIPPEAFATAALKAHAEARVLMRSTPE